MLNFALTVAELTARQLYFRSPSLQRWCAGSGGAGTPAAPRILALSELLQRLETLGIRSGDSLMVHAGISTIRVVDDLFADPGNGGTADGIAAANLLLRTLRQAVGDRGTLLMPTFPKYPDEPEYFSPENDGSRIQTYDPRRTPSKSGLLSELFRKRPGTMRSAFPIQTVAAQGPKAAWYTDRNIEDGRGLAHGPESPYGRLVRDRAHVISLGVPLVDYCTLIHAPEEARFDQWPVQGFWRETFYDVVRSGATSRVLVWERVPRFSLGYAEERMRRDLRREGVVKEGAVGTVEVHGLKAEELFELFMHYNAHTSYPFFWPAISRL